MPGLPRGQGQARSVTPGGAESPARKKMTKTTRARSKSSKGLRSKSRTPNMSPLQAQLEETQMYIKPHMDDITNCKTAQDRLVMIYRLLPDDVTSIDRLWPLELTNKDSRLRIDLSEQGKECYVAGDHRQSLELYNKALTYSSGKGIAHTLARRAAFFLATKEHQLALRDLTVALEYGVLETEELLDFLLTHHSTEDTGTAYDNGEEMMNKTLENIQNMHTDKPVSENQKYMWAKKIKDNLNAALLTEKKKDVVAKDDILKNIVESIKAAAKEHNLDVNLECEELTVPKIEEKNPIYPAFSEAAAVFKEAGDDRGRHVKARRDILAGEVIAVDEPHCAMLCPQDFGHIKNHCLHCFRFVRAPLPCELCCCVVFCSKECKSLACTSYHKYECQLRLYELLPQEGQDVFGLFMSLRSITQKPLEYFMEHQDELEKYLDRDEAKPVVQHGRYLSSDYKTLLNLATHCSDLSEDIIMRNTVLSIVFLRSLQYSGYFSKYIKPRMKGDRFTITPIEILILRLLYHLIAVQSFNSHPIMRLSAEDGSFNWEKIGTCLNPSMALFNHSCDANTVRCNVNRSSVLVAAEHIPAGVEITDSYAVHFSNTLMDKRQYHTLKNYMFGCECPACMGKWKLADEIPDELARVPNFEQEANFKVRFGDKKWIVDDIRDARRLAELCMNKKAFDDALNAYQDLCQLLEEHVRKPHAYYLQARAGITHCIWNKYCKTPTDTNQQDEEEEFLSGKNNPIYMNQVVENITEINLHNVAEPEAEDEENIDNEKAELIKKTKELVKSSMDKTQDAKQVVLQNKQTALAATAMVNSKASSMCSNGKPNLEPWVVEQYTEEQNRKKSVREEQVESEVGESIAKEAMKELLLVDQKQAAEMAKKKQQRQEEEKVRIAEAEKRKLERQRECEERSKRLIQQDKEKRQRQKEQEERIMLERKSRKDKELERRRAKEIEEMRIERELQRKKEEEELAKLLNETSGNSDECLENIEDEELIADLLKDLDNEEFLIKDEQDDNKTHTVSVQNDDKTHNNYAINDIKEKEKFQGRTTSEDKTAKIENQCDVQIENSNKIDLIKRQGLSNMENKNDEIILVDTDSIKIEKNNGTTVGFEKSVKMENDSTKQTEEQHSPDKRENKYKENTNNNTNTVEITGTLDDLDDFINNTAPKKSEPKEEEDAGNVWAILRKIKDTNYTEDCKKEIRKEQKDLEDTIKNFADIINKKKKLQDEGQKRKLAKISSDMETIEEDVLPENNLPKDCMKSNNESTIKSENEDTIPKVSTKEEEPISKHSILSSIEESENFFKQAEKFDYATWRDKTVIDVTPIEELSPEKLAADREYLESLKNKIHTNIQKKKEIEKKDDKKEKKMTLPKLNKGKSEKKTLTEPESFEALKSKDKERKRKKRDEKTKAAFEGAQDKTREVNLKSNKIEKRAEENKKHIEQLKEKSIVLRQQSELKEMEFNDISLHFDDLSSLETKLDCKTKKGRKVSRQIKENPISLDIVDHVHWTEEETNAWPTADPDKVHSMLGAIKAAAAASASKGNKIDGKSFADDLRNKITTCHKEIEMERKQKEEEANKKRTAELKKIEEAKAKKILENAKEESIKRKEKEACDNTRNVYDKNSKDTKNDKKDKNISVIKVSNGEIKKETEATNRIEHRDKKISAMKNDSDLLTNGSTGNTKNNKIDNEKNLLKENNIKTSNTVSKTHMESQTRKKVPSMRWSGSELFEQDISDSSDSLCSTNMSQEIYNKNTKDPDTKTTNGEILRVEQQKVNKEFKNKDDNKRTTANTENTSELTNSDKQQEKEISNLQDNDSSKGEVKEEEIKPNKNLVKTSESVSRNHMDSESKKKNLSMRWSGSELFQQDSSESSDSLYNTNACPEIKDRSLDYSEIIKHSKDESYHLEQQKVKEEAETRKHEIEKTLKEQERIKREEKEKERKRKQQEQENAIKKKAAEMMKREEEEAKVKLEKIAIDKRKQEEKEILEKKKAEDAKKKKEIENMEKLKLEKIAKMKEKEAKIAEEKKRQEEAIRKEEARQKEKMKQEENEILEKRKAEDAKRKKEEEEAKVKLEKIAIEKRKQEEKEILTKKKAEDTKKKKEIENMEKLKLEKIAKMKEKEAKIAEEKKRQEEAIRKEEVRQKEIREAEIMLNKLREEVEEKKKTSVATKKKKREEDSVCNKKDAELVVKRNKSKEESISKTKESELKVKPSLMVVNTNTDLEVSPVSLRKMPSEPRKEVLSMRWSGAEMFQDLNQEPMASFKFDVIAPTICEDVVEVKIQLPEPKLNTKMSLNDTSFKTAEEAFEESILETIKQRIPSPMQIDEYAENVKRYSENVPKPNTQLDPPLTRQSKKDIFQAQNESSLSQQDTMQSQSNTMQSQTRQRSQSLPRPPPPKFKPPPPPPL